METRCDASVDVPDHDEVRQRLADARVCLLFSPELCRGRDPLAVLEAALPEVDMVQIRPKSPTPLGPSAEPCAARETFEWCLRALDLTRARPSSRTLVTVDDRVDVAKALWDRGCAGVHVGREDCPPAVARAFLGPGPLIGFSTHSLAQVVEAEDLPVDYLGFGPVHATATKGYARGLGAESAWIASTSAGRPVFLIGGIDATNAGELARGAWTGRVAVGSAILAADDPARAARELRALLAGG